MKVLIATDGSKFSELALRFVVHRPWPTGSEVKIKDLNNSALKEARTVADAGSRMLSRLEGKVSTDTPFPQGSIAGTIVKKAEEWGAQLIVLGPHGRRKFDRLIAGERFGACRISWSCSVEVIREKQSKRMSLR